jgi:hypothetical protein
MKQLFMVLEIDDQAFVRTSRLAFILHRIFGKSTWDSIVARIWRRGICMHFVHARQRIRFYGLCCFIKLIDHALSFALIHPCPCAAKFTRRKSGLI